MAKRTKNDDYDREAQRRIAQDILDNLPEGSMNDPDYKAEWERNKAIVESLSGVKRTETDDGGYDVDQMNDEYAFVLAGSQSIIIQFCETAGVDERLRFLRLDAFRAYYLNRFTEVQGSDGKIKRITWANRWIEDAERRDYKGITFYPDPYMEPGPEDRLNLWQGFSVEPSPNGSYDVFRDHLLTNVCNANKDHFEWLFAWFANMVQKPRDKPGTAVVLRGEQGSGKTTVGKIFGSLIEAHHQLADEARYVTGNFNSHMASCLLLQADEATWAGDKAAEGRLKGLVTSDMQMIEAKGVDAIRLPNYVRVLMSTNHDWAVPAGKEERRFAVFDVAAHAARNHNYFGEMLAEMDSGGRERLLHDLLNFDLSKVNLREIPKTSALLEQKMHSLDPIEEWLRDRLAAGAPTRGHDGWPSRVETDAMHDDYIRASDRTGIRRKSSQTQFGAKLAKILPGLRKKREMVANDEAATTRRAYVYHLPPLAECREAFASQFGQAIDWGDDDAE